MTPQIIQRRQSGARSPAIWKGVISGCRPRTRKGQKPVADSGTGPITPLRSQHGRSAGPYSRRRNLILQYRRCACAFATGKRGVDYDRRGGLALQTRAKPEDTMAPDYPFEACFPLYVYRPAADTSGPDPHGAAMPDRTGAVNFTGVSDGCRGSGIGCRTMPFSFEFEQSVSMRAVFADTLHPNPDTLFWSFSMLGNE